MDEKIKSELDRIIDGKWIKAVFQPIVSLRDGSVMGYEALSRITCESAIANPEDLFRFAGESSRLWDLELLCRTTALQAAYLKTEPESKKKLFLNVNPDVMHDTKFRQGFTKEYLKNYGAVPEDIIFEITERNAASDMESFHGAVTHYKDQNYKIAIDDAGAGYSGLNLISDINPHYIKLDMNLIRNIDKDSIKFALVKSMTELSHVANISLVAEGVETPEELVTLIDLGVQYAQGYYLQRPDEQMKEVAPDVLAFIKETNRRKSHVLGSQASNIYIQNICTATQTIPPTKKVEDVFEELKKDPSSFGMCVVENGTVLGVVTKSNLVLKLSGRYGFSLNQKRPIASLMDRQFLAVSYQTPISDVSRIAMSRSPEKLYDFIVVTRDEKYLGTVTIKDLLEKTTEIEVANAKYQNPLTGLPGNLVIEQKIQSCMERKTPYSVIYFDIDNFKAYNDVYGFENGDAIIKLLAKTIVCHVPVKQFAGHVGGDDFVAVLDNFSGIDLCINIIHDFDKNVLQYYNPRDIANGYILAENRRGEPEKFPLISLSVAGVSNRTRSFSTMQELTEELARVKKKTKQQSGSFCCLE
ncbi:GGDEF domain-containing protein [Caproiciproducens faecalis]|uniref:GGDEF domain-containing protein n=1 Tax=Caproiciproducens faecalis TaxID=2820301 RepID=A0ABS7DLL7_9FIRM|nr:GGDEF domain-containing protein [Caproiciproducens faecalis]MBW7572186.1 GGDEF domain-containing protein [Caproiciproducens faecalis]